MTIETLTPLPIPTASDLVRLQRYDSAARVRGLIEMGCVRRLVEEILKNSHMDITVDDGGDDGGDDGDEPVKRSREIEEIIEAVFAVDESRIYIHDSRYKSPINPFAWVDIIGGNGPDLFTDYSTNIETIMEPVNDYAESLAEWV